MYLISVYQFSKIGEETPSFEKEFGQVRVPLVETTRKEVVSRLASK